MAGIHMNSIDALTLAVMAKTGKSPLEARETAEMLEVFFKKCSNQLTENYYWTVDDLMALVEIILTEIPESLR